MRDDSSRTPPADRRPAGGGGARRRRRPAGHPVTKTTRPQDEADERPVPDEEDEKLLDRVWATSRQGRPAPAPAGAAGRPRPAATRTLEVAELDADLGNADWIKGRTWDILPPTTEALLEALNVESAPVAEQKAAVSAFLKLPAARAMPPAVRAGLRRLGLLGD